MGHNIANVRTPESPNKQTIDRKYLDTFLYNNEHNYKNYTNVSAAIEDLLTGRLMALDPATDTLLLFDSAGAFPANNFFGILSKSVEVDISETVNMRVAISGDVNSNIIVPETDIPYVSGAGFNVIYKPVTETGKFDNDTSS